MPDALVHKVIARTCRDSLILVASHYEDLGDNVFVYRGVRPTDGRWHRHGFLDVQRRCLIGWRLTSVTIRKQRWSRPDRSATRHSRPPDDLGCRYDALVIAVVLFTAIDAAVGLHHVGWPFRTRAVEDAPSTRTVQRWLSLALNHATRLHQVLRDVATERCEPRPETLFPKGLSPPVQQQKRRWRSPSTVSKLWRGFTMVLEASTGKQIVPTATLLAEARGRWTLTDPLRDA